VSVFTKKAKWYFYFKYFYSSIH